MALVSGGPNCAKVGSGTVGSPASGNGLGIAIVAS